MSRVCASLHQIVSHDFCRLRKASSEGDRTICPPTCEHHKAETVEAEDPTPPPVRVNHHIGKPKREPKPKYYCADCLQEGATREVHKDGARCAPHFQAIQRAIFARWATHRARVRAAEGAAK